MCVAPCTLEITLTDDFRCIILNITVNLNLGNGSDNEKCSAFIRKVRFDVRKLCYFNLVFIIFENLLFLNFMNLISDLKSSIFGVDFRFLFFDM